MSDLHLSYLRTRWPLLLVLLVFIFFKIPQLHYPFYIDEGWVYAPAVKTMAMHGPSLMPNAISPDLSRGHPLMFHFLCSLWIRCFGLSNAAIHAFPLLVSVIFLIVLFEGCLQLFGKRVAVLVVLLTATRVIFFVDSSFVYPEVMLAMFAFLSLYCYSRGLLLLTSLMLFMLFFTKEGGLVIGAVVGVDAFVGLFSKNESIVMRIQRLAAVMVPTCLIAIFFAIQKAKLGWYVFPEHEGMIRPDWDAYYTMFKSVLYWTFRGDHAMYILVFFTTLLSIIPALRFKNIRYLFLILPIIVVYRQAQMFPTPTLHNVLWMIVFIVFFSAPVFFVLRLNKMMGTSQRRFIVLMAICVITYVLYSSLTQVAYRYLIVCIVFVLIFLAVCMNTFIEAGDRRLFYIALAGVLLIGAYGFYSNDRAEDTQLGAFRVMNVQMQEFSYLEKENAYDKEIVFGCTWEMLRLTDTMQGFLSSRRTFTHMKRFPIGPQTEYAIFTNSCDNNPPADYQQILANPTFHSVYKVSDGEIWAEVFKRN